MPVRPDPTASTRPSWPWKALHGSQGLYTGTTEKLKVFIPRLMKSRSSHTDKIDEQIITSLLNFHGVLGFPFDVISKYKN